MASSRPGLLGRVTARLSGQPAAFPIDPALRALLAGRLEPGERLLAAAAESFGDRLVASTRGLWRVPREAVTATDSESAARLDWEAIDLVTWRDPVLAVVEAGEVRDSIAYGPRPQWEVTLESGTALAATIRERVTRSVGVSQKVRLDGAQGRSVRAVGRRVPGRPTLRWSLVFDRDADAADPVLAEQARALLAQAQESVGE